METDVKPSTMCDMFNRIWSHLTYDVEELPEKMQEQYHSRIAEILALRSMEGQFMKSYILLHALQEEIRIELACIAFQANTAGQLRYNDDLSEKLKVHISL